MDKGSEMGPCYKRTLDKVRGYVDIGVKEGAKLVVDGRGFKIQGYEKGYYIGGCLFDHAKGHALIKKKYLAQFCLC